MLKKKITYCEALMHLTKCMMGAGIFSMGNAFKCGGLVIGLVCVPLLALVEIYCIHLLMNVSDYATELYTKDISELDTNSDPGEQELCLSYPQVTQIVLEHSGFLNWAAKPLSVFVSTMICTMILGITTYYIIFVATTLSGVLEYYELHLHIRYLMLIVAAVAWTLVMIPNLSSLAFVSFTAINIIFVCIAVTFYFCILEFASRNWSINNVQMVGSTEGFAPMIGTALFSFEVIAMVSVLKSEMQKPQQFMSAFGVLHMTFVGVVTIVVSFGCVTYLAYGDALEDVIMTSFPNNWIRMAVNLLLAVQVLLTYPLQLYIAFKVLWSIVSTGKALRCPCLYEYLLRTALVLITLVAAQALPFIDVMVSFLGSLSSSTLTVFICPFLDTIMHLSTKSPHLKLIIFKNACLMFLAVLVLLLGLQSTVNLCTLHYQSQ